MPPPPATPSRPSTKPGHPAKQSAAQGSGVKAMMTWGANVRGVGASAPSISVASLLSSHQDQSSGGEQLKAQTANAGHNSTQSSGLPRSGTADGSGNLRRFEDFCATFPVDRPTTAKTLSLTAMEATATGAGARNGRESPLDDEMRRLETDMAGKRVAKETAQKSYDVLRRHKIDQWTQLAEKHNRKLRKENEMLTKIAEITQHAALDNDTRYEEAVTALRAQVEFTGLYRGRDNETMSFIRESIGDIQDRLAQIQQASQREVQAELANIRAGFEAQVQSRAEELEQARAAGQSTTEAWVQESRSLQDEVEKLLIATDAAHGRHKQLSRKHQRLRIEKEAQQDDAVLLARQWTLVSAQHNRLKDRVSDLDIAICGAREARAAGLPENASSGDAVEFDNLGRSPLASASGGGTNAASALDEEGHGQRLALALHRAQALLESEQQALASVRKAHLAALQQRTELEVYLRSAVLRHQHRLVQQHYADREGRRATSQGYALNATASSAAKVHPLATSDATHAIISSTSFTADDRRLVIESLLAVPRVLQLVYRGGAGPAADLVQTRADLLSIGAPHADVISAAAAATDPDDARQGTAPVPAEIDERALEQLWSRWQRWTANANETFAAAERSRNVNGTS